ncbi:reverse transcriptase domain-containing protein [Tanacetum coccineum]
MQEVVKKEIVKLLDTDIIYPITDSIWVSPIHCVPKKGGITVVTNENDELDPTRIITGWRVCIDYRKLNEATAKDHFSLPFMYQMLERFKGNKYFCFLDGFSRYFQIPIDPIDQEKTTFTCPFGTYAYRRMPFGLCNVPATFQRCMLAIFHNMIEELVKVFMDDFSVFGNSFDCHLNNLDKMLQCCNDAHLVLNSEICHFMVKEGIVLGHKVSGAGLEVDKAKIDVISKLPPSTNIKGVRSFLGHDAFELLKEKLTCAPVIVSPNWNLPFELIYDASDFAVEAVLGDIIPKGMMYQQKNKFFSDLKHYFWEEPVFSKYVLMAIDFMGPFPKSHKFKYILVAVDYVSKWAKAQALPTNDARVVITFLKKLLCRLGIPKALISDRGTHFCNKIMEKTRKRYGVSHHFSTLYHPQTSGQVENINRAIKRILEKTVKDNPFIWSRKLDDALWAFHTAYKTPTGTTPYKLIYGKNNHLPFEIEHRAY